MTDLERQHNILLGRSNCRDARTERSRRYVETHRALFAEIAARRKPLVPIVERMQAEADAERKVAA
jgi:hypothetical protein